MMEKTETKESLVFRWRIALSAAAVALAAAAIALNLFAASRSEAEIRRNVDAVLAERFSDAFAERDAPVAGSRVYSERSGSAFEFVFLARARNLADNAYSGDLIFVAPVTGFSGPALSVFYYTQDLGARFIGNCRALSGYGADTEISLGSLKKWASRIEAAAPGFFGGASAATASSAGMPEW